MNNSDFPGEGNYFFVGGCASKKKKKKKKAQFVSGLTIRKFNK